MLGLINEGINHDGTTVFAFHKSVFLPKIDIGGARSAFRSTSLSLRPLAAHHRPRTSMAISPLYSSLLFHYSSVVHMKYYPQLWRLQPWIYAMTTPGSQDSVLSLSEMKNRPSY
jgi:hypothetical protein